jgi:hypothetical protein
MPFARGDVRESHRFTQKRPESFVWALRSIAVVEPAKNQLLRDFRRRSIFGLLQHYRGKSGHRSGTREVRKNSERTCLWRHWRAARLVRSRR